MAGREVVMGVGAPGDVVEGDGGMAMGEGCKEGVAIAGGGMRTVDRGARGGSGGGGKLGEGACIAEGIGGEAVGGLGEGG